MIDCMYCPRRIPTVGNGEHISSVHYVMKTSTITWSSSEVYTKVIRARLYTHTHTHTHIELKIFRSTSRLWAKETGMRRTRTSTCMNDIATASKMLAQQNCAKLQLHFVLSCGRHAIMRMRVRLTWQGDTKVWTARDQSRSTIRHSLRLLPRTYVRPREG